MAVENVCKLEKTLLRGITVLQNVLHLRDRGLGSGVFGGPSEIGRVGVFPELKQQTVRIGVDRVGHRRHRQDRGFREMDLDFLVVNLCDELSEKVRAWTALIADNGHETHWFGHGPEPLESLLRLGVFRRGKNGTACSLGVTLVCLVRK